MAGERELNSFSVTSSYRVDEVAVVEADCKRRADVVDFDLVVCAART